MRSRLQAFVGECLSKSLPGYQIIEDSWPDWLKQLTGRRLQLDFYLPEMKIAIEVQGEQHYRQISRFHPTRARFDEAQRRDELKRQACAYQNIQLLTIDDKTDAIQVVAQLAQLWTERACFRGQLSDEQRERQKVRGRRRKRYWIHTNDRAHSFEVSRQFFDEVILSDRVRRLDRHSALARPEYILWREWSKGTVVFQRRIVDVEEKSPPSTAQAEPA